MSQVTKERKSQARTQSQKLPISPETHYEDNKIAQIRKASYCGRKGNSECLSTFSEEACNTDT